MRLLPFRKYSFPKLRCYIYTLVSFSGEKGSVLYVSWKNMMLFLFFHLSFLLLTANPYPYPALDPLQLPGSNVTQGVTSNVHFNTSVAAPHNGSASTISNDVTCYIPTERVPIVTTIQDCTIIFHKLRRLPFYRTMQPFLEGIRPRIYLDHPIYKTPPFLVINNTPTGGNCALYLSSVEPHGQDIFSWEQVELVGQAIMQTCGSPSYGGRGKVGLDNRWLVRLYGYENRAALAAT